MLELSLSYHLRGQLGPYVNFGTVKYTYNVGNEYRLLYSILYS
jgi:hypothetical protein